MHVCVCMHVCVHMLVYACVCTERALERDRFMSAEEAKDFGLIDTVISKRTA